MASPPNRIVGGQEAAMLQYPWVTFLTYRGNFYCGATVISDRYLLTAAHCVDRYLIILEKLINNNSLNYPWNLY